MSRKFFVHDRNLRHPTCKIKTINEAFSFIVFILDVGFPTYWETTQFAPNIQQQNHPFMERQHFEKHSPFPDSMDSCWVCKWEDFLE